MDSLSPNTGAIPASRVPQELLLRRETLVVGIVSCTARRRLEQFGAIYLSRLSGLKDELCTCHDDACVQDVLGHMDKFAFEFQGFQPPPAADTQLKSIGREITACREALGSEYRGLYKE